MHAPTASPAPTTGSDAARRAERAGTGEGHGIAMDQDAPAPAAPAFSETPSTIATVGHHAAVDEDAGQGADFDRAAAAGP